MGHASLLEMIGTWTHCKDIDHNFVFLVLRQKVHELIELMSSFYQHVCIGESLERQKKLVNVCARFCASVRVSQCR